MILGQMKMYDIVFDNPRILLVLEHLQIPLGFGEHTIEEMCRGNSINEHLFLTIANLYCCKDSVKIHAHRFDNSDATRMLQFLKTAHNYYLDEKIPKLKMLIEQKVQNSPDEKYSLIIQKFINDYSTEVYEHIKYENEIVFPYVESLLRQQKQQAAGFTIENFEKHHTNIEDKLIDLRSLLIKHVPVDYDSVVRRRMLFELYDLEHDINIHDYIENKILIPVVKSLEKESK